jgi:hypothetical protein
MLTGGEHAEDPTTKPDNYRRLVIEVSSLSFGHYYHTNRPARLQKGVQLLEMVEKQIKDGR